jgi:hypothetical protein
MFYNINMSKSKIWTLEKVRDGFEKFYKINNRYPVAYDVDDCDYLPSSRQIQRSFGGLLNLRKNLGLKIENYGQGMQRSNLVSSFNIRGRQYENIVFNLLKEYFDDKFIHVEKPTSKEGCDDEYNSKDRYDFYVYAKPNNFAVDVFGTDATRGVVNIMNIKEKKYRKINSKENLYFVYFGDNIIKDKVKKWMLARKIKFPPNWQVIDLADFKQELSAYEAYKAI